MKPGDYVRTCEPAMGFAQGPHRDQHGDGQPREIPAGALCEIFSINRATGWVTVHFDLDDSGQKEPYRVEAIVEPDMLTMGTRPSLPPMIPEGAEFPE
ncbi:MAG TPA: hypothetical protein VK501_24535 [Baekduia sp.]|uniref:hypothetical protein n=1 Tax=Baekduia sp. TaxID=2600305 RepID=UPI002C716B45|nr:hypothetical protein [Baekduia sp.]HMJ37095.1 hypothetical protein [Baekduia sp.]